jgi:hypothetical protein
MLGLALFTTMGELIGVSTETAKRVTYRDVFAVREYRALWAGFTVSLMGDNLAQVAIAVLVFARTHSPLLTAVTYSLLYLPPIFGGPLLSALADLLPSRAVLIVSDVLRVVLVGVMAVPGMPVWALDVLLTIVTLADLPYSAGRAELGPTVLPDELWQLGGAITATTGQFCQIAGFVAGAFAVGTLDPHGSLLLDAATFALSAGLVALWVRPRPRASVHAGTEVSLHAVWRQTKAGAMVVFGDRGLRTLMLFGWLSAMFVVPEALAAPYAHALGHGAVAVGLMMATLPAGMAIGTVCVLRVPSPSRAALLGPLAIVSFVPLAMCALRPPLYAVLVLWTLAGAATAYQVIAMGAFTRLLPEGSRGTAFGFASSGVLAAQGLGLIAGGAIAEAIGPQLAVGLAGLAGVLAAAMITLAGRGVINSRLVVIR